MGAEGTRILSVLETNWWQEWKTFFDRIWKRKEFPFQHTQSFFWSFWLCRKKLRCLEWTIFFYKIRKRKNSHFQDSCQDFCDVFDTHVSLLSSENETFFNYITQGVLRMWCVKNSQTIDRQNPKGNKQLTTSEQNEWRLSFTTIFAVDQRCDRHDRRVWNLTVQCQLFD
jgi:hypothetical protein